MTGDIATIARERVERVLHSWLADHWSHVPPLGKIVADLVRAAQHDGVRAATIEECAQVAEKLANATSISVTKGPDWTLESGNAQLYNSCARRVAADIRALGS